MTKFKVSTGVACGLMTVAVATLSCAKSDLKGASHSVPAPKKPQTADADKDGQPQPKAESVKTDTSTGAVVAPAAAVPVGVVPPAGAPAAGGMPVVNQAVSPALLVGSAGTVIDPSLNSDAETIKQCLNLWKKGHPFKVVNKENFQFHDVKVAADVGSIANTLFGGAFGGVKIASTSVGGFNDQAVSAVDKLIVVGFSLNYGSVEWKMMNPKGWYCVKGAVAGAETTAKVVIKKHCTAQLASSDLNFAYDTATQKLAINEPGSGGQIGFAFNSKFEVQPMLNLSGAPCN